MMGAEVREVERKYDVDPGCRIPGVSKLPGTIRTAPVVELDQVTVYDGGDDGYTDTRDDNTPLAVQGVFVP